MSVSWPEFYWKHREINLCLGHYIVMMLVNIYIRNAFYNYHVLLYYIVNILNTSVGVSLLCLRITRSLAIFAWNHKNTHSMWMNTAFAIAKWTLLPFCYHNKTFPRVWYCKIVLLSDHWRPVGHVLSHFNTHLVGLLL